MALSCRPPFDQDQKETLMPHYVDGFIVPIPKSKLAAYLRMARLGAKVWKEHGALEYVECLADDVSWGKRTSFQRAVKMNRRSETVVFSYIVYKSRRDRDRINKKVMTDPRLKDMMDLKKLPFDAKRMIYGGFRTIVEK
jgi:uncharacterized protein YbaA (DUF1428 family)